MMRDKGWAIHFSSRELVSGAWDVRVYLMPAAPAELDSALFTGTATYPTRAEALQAGAFLGQQAVERREGVGAP
jgi:hypothetical protein